MEWKIFLTIIISMVFVNNFILSKFLGLCPFLGVSRQIKPAMSMGMAVIFVMTLSGAITWLLYRFILIPLNITYLRTITFILVIAAFVQFVEMVIQKKSPPLYRALGIYLPLITTNCAVLGVTVLNIDTFFVQGKPVGFSFLLALTQSFFAGAGFTLALLLMSGIRERLQLNDTPRYFQGVAIAFIIASLMSLAFMGFNGFRF
ncbi:MAG: RnfABCDGE type electron transport complex subunit A [Candidatus Omnitrophica bacterium]|nr:RnfABCDGE type electron transport complex subunit A [Candidatus Omnitrophota bacterium]